MGVNSNYVTGVRGFTDAIYYEAAEAGEFNPATGFGAAVVFMLDGAAQVAPAAVPDPMTLWGNYDSGGNTGWRLYIGVDGNNQWTFGADFGTGLATVSLAVPFTDDTLRFPGFIERLIHMSLWFDLENTRGGLAVNGNLLATAAVAAYGPSALAPTLGVNAVVAHDEPATYATIVGAGFGPVNYASNRIMGSLAASSFTAARRAYGIGGLVDGQSTDWTHKYDMQSTPPGITGTTTKTARGVVPATLPAAPTALADVGNNGPVATQTDPTAPTVPLTRVGTGLTQRQLENPDWYTGLSTTFPAPQ